MIRQIKIPEYPREVKLSDSQRAIYYKLIKGELLVGKKRKRIPKEVKTKLSNGIYCIKDDIVVDKISNKPIIANHTKVGTPRTAPIKFNDLWSNKGWFLRDKITIQLKEYCSGYINTKLVSPVEKNMYPLNIIIELHDTVKNPFDKKKWYDQRWDGNNLCMIYHKVLVDLLVSQGIIIDDDRMYIRDVSYFVPLPVEMEHKDRFISINIETLADDRVIKNTYYKDFMLHLVNDVPFKKENNIKQPVKIKSLWEQ